MKQIWKFPFEVEGLVYIEMPKGAKVLTVQTQNEVPCMWVLVDPEAEKETRIFRTFGTGHLLNWEENWKHIGTFQLKDGAFIGHVFE